MKKILLFSLCLYGFSAMGQLNLQQVSPLFSYLGEEVLTLNKRQLLGKDYITNMQNMKATNGAAEIYFTIPGEMLEAGKQDMMNSRYLSEIRVREAFFDEHAYKDNLPFELKKGVKLKKWKKEAAGNPHMENLVINDPMGKVTFLYTLVSPFKGKHGVEVELLFLGSGIHQIRLYEPN